MKTIKSCILLFVMWCALFATALTYGQIHIKDNQTFHLGIGNDGVEIETSRNLYIRAGLSVDKAIGCIGKMYAIPAGVFGLEYGVDKKLTEKLFIGGRVYNDWIAKNTGTESKIGWGVRLGFVL